MTDTVHERVKVDESGPVWAIELCHTARRNAVDADMAKALYEAVLRFEADPFGRVLVLHGAGGTFCAGADLKAVADGRANPLEPGPLGSLAPMGPTRLATTKPTIAAISGHAVAGGLELALWCDLRVAEVDSVMGVFCRRFGVPLIDGGTIRLPRIIGLSRALDLILTGRAVSADEALQMGLVNRVVARGEALTHALALAQSLIALPWQCLSNDRQSVYEGLDQPLPDAMENEFKLGMATLSSGETIAGATQFAKGAGRHGNDR